MLIGSGCPSPSWKSKSSYTHVHTRRQPTTSNSSEQQLFLRKGAKSANRWLGSVGLQSFNSNVSVAIPSAICWQDAQLRVGRLRSAGLVCECVWIQQTSGQDKRRIKKRDALPRGLTHVACSFDLLAPHLCPIHTTIRFMRVLCTWWLSIHERFRHAKEKLVEFLVGSWAPCRSGSKLVLSVNIAYVLLGTSSILATALLLVVGLRFRCFVYARNWQMKISGIVRFVRRVFRRFYFCCGTVRHVKAIVPCSHSLFEVMPRGPSKSRGEGGPPGPIRAACTFRHSFGLLWGFVGLTLLLTGGACSFPSSASFRACSHAGHDFELFVAFPRPTACPGDREAALQRCCAAEQQERCCK